MEGENILYHVYGYILFQFLFIHLVPITTSFLLLGNSSRLQFTTCEPYHVFIEHQDL